MNTPTRDLVAKLMDVGRDPNLAISWNTDYSCERPVWTFFLQLDTPGARARAREALNDLADGLHPRRWHK